MIREPVYQALFLRLATLPGLVTTSRRLKHWSDVAPAQQPALFQVQAAESPQQTEGRPPVWRARVDVYLYVHAGADPDAVPATTLNRLVDAIEQALTPASGEASQTLGGLVEHCWISGTIASDEGALGAQAVAIVPIELLVAA